MRLKVKNNSETMLTAAMAVDATTASVQDASALPACPFRCTIEGEIIEVGDKDTSTNMLSNILRAQEDTTAAEHASGASVEVRLTAGYCDELPEIRLYADGATIPSLPDGVIALVYEEEA